MYDPRSASHQPRRLIWMQGLAHLNIPLFEVLLVVLTHKFSGFHGKLLHIRIAYDESLHATFLRNGSSSSRLNRLHDTGQTTTSIHNRSDLQHGNTPHLICRTAESSTLYLQGTSGTPDLPGLNIIIRVPPSSKLTRIVPFCREIFCQCRHMITGSGHVRSSLPTSPSRALETAVAMQLRGACS